jgi:hypothetical protein
MDLGAAEAGGGLTAFPFASCHQQVRSTSTTTKLMIPERKTAHVVDGNLSHLEFYAS